MSEPSTPAAMTTVPAHSDWQKREVSLAIQNALKLGGSLTLTWGIALLVRLYVPRFLGPERFGALSFADAFAATAFVFLTLGIDPYVRKEIAVRPNHASDFVGGIMVLRLLMTLLVFAGMEVFLRLTNRSAEVRYLVYIFGIAQFFLVGNSTSSGLLHAKGSVTEMSVASVVVKILWGLSILAAIVLDLGLWAFAAAFLLSEALKSLVLFVLTRRHLSLSVRIDPKAVGAVMLASLPFYLSTISTTIYNKVDMSILAVVADNREVGLYGAATSLAGLTLLLTPLISWVLMPLYARAAAVSEAELCSLVRRSLELILAMTIPVALLMAAGADVWIRVVFGQAFAGATMALRVLAVVFLVMYVSIVCWCALTMLNKRWSLAAVFAGGLVVNPLLNLTLIERGLAMFGEGGGGAACAVSTLITELVVVTPMLILMGARTLDKRLSSMLIKCLTSATLVFVADLFLQRYLGPERLVLDLVAYVALIRVTRAVDVREMIEWTKTALERRKETADAAE